MSHGEGDVTWTAAENAAVIAKGLKIVKELRQAHIYIVANLAAPPFEWLRWAQLFGGRLTTKAFITSSVAGAPPASVKYVPAPLRLKLFLFLSPRYRKEREVLSNFIGEAAKLPGSRWTVLADFEAWLEVSKSNSSTSIAVYTTRELADKIGVHPLGVSGTAFFDRVATVSVAASCDGMTQVVKSQHHANISLSSDWSSGVSGRS